MAGYHGHGMSNNAIDAYARGLVPASKIKGIPVDLIDRFCGPDEWHHSSKFYNVVNFYDAKAVVETFTNDPAAASALAARKAEKAAKIATYHDASSVEWTEFNKAGRGHWSARERKFEGLVRVRGTMIDMLDTDGVITKKTTGRHLLYRLGKTVTVRTWNLRQKKIEEAEKAARVEMVARMMAAQVVKAVVAVNDGTWKDPATPFPTEGDLAHIREVRLTRLFLNSPAPDLSAIFQAAGMDSFPAIRPAGFPKASFRLARELVDAV